MKKSITVFLALIGTVAVCAKEGKAQQFPARHPARVTFQVDDDFGHPVAGVEMALSTFGHWQPGEGFGRDVNTVVTGKSDAKGLVTLDGQSLRGDCSYGPLPISGYYAGGGGRYQFKEVKDGRWEPWNPVIKVTIKPVLKPVPMYARKLGVITRKVELPVLGKPAGFDLIEGDWVAPYGRGKKPDFIFALIETVPLTDASKAFDYTLAVTFPATGDGIQSVLGEPSALNLPRFAPTDGYSEKLQKRMFRPDKGKPIDSGTRENQNYFFRVRTVRNEQGVIQSALYGKIRGDIACDVINSRKGYLRFTYYVNPTPLDTNMEFDPRNNLFHELPKFESVNEP